MLKNETTLIVFVSKKFDQVENIVDSLKSHGLDAIFSSEANKPYAVKVTTTFNKAAEVLTQINDAIAEYV